MQVNYVREHERFIEYAADERVPANVQLLWYALMHIFNQRAEGAEWPDGFIRITNDRLFTYLPIKWDAMARARNALKQMGRIDFRNGNRNRTAPEYRIIPFYPSCYPFKTDNTWGNTGGNEGGNTRGNTWGNPGDINININDNETGTVTGREDDEVNYDDIIRARTREDEDGETAEDRETRTEIIRGAFRASFGRTPYPAELDDIVRCSSRMGFSPQMAAIAVRKSASAGASSPAEYTAAIMGKWRREEVRQPHQADELDAEFYTTKHGMIFRDTADGYETKKEERRKENERAGIA